MVSCIRGYKGALTVIIYVMTLNVKSCTLNIDMQ